MKVPIHDSLRIYVWPGYLDPSVVTDFEREFGIHLDISNFDSNDQLRVSIEGGESSDTQNSTNRYDLIMPSAYLARHFIEQNLLFPLDRDQIPNLKYLDRNFTRPDYDPELVYTVPYFWGSLGIAYQSDQLEIPFDWSDLFAPPDLRAPLDLDRKNRITIVDESRSALGSALIYLKCSPNSTNRNEIEAAGEVLERLRPFIYKFDGNFVHEDLANRKVLMALAWSGEAQLAQSTNPAVRFSIPEDGAILFLDVFAIPKTTRKKELVEKFLNFLLRPSISARNINSSAYAGTSLGAEPFVSPAILNGPAYRAPQPKKSFLLEDLGPEVEKIYEEVWSKIYAIGQINPANAGSQLHGLGTKKK